jgi:hypothetical protein
MDDDFFTPDYTTPRREITAAEWLDMAAKARAGIAGDCYLAKHYENNARIAARYAEAGG